ncbi:helix-turn-helix domain-containing protein [Pelagovum sp. HNIBRBA483]|uniref:helix-turn-helix domain-containing protein n=1 Tax=Pelagovum sp. HNIBRBA483 TaxID=3233341 RepID=UPI0034A2F664
MTDFATLLRQWRRSQRHSQLSLAHEAGISARHLSFLESARARPSRNMVMQLAQALDLPRVRVNEFLTAAGFAAAYSQTPLDAEALAPVRAALERVMENHAPYPAVLMDRDWGILGMNGAAERLFGMAGIGMGGSGLALLDLPEGPAAWIENWPEVGHHLLTRLEVESRALGGRRVLDRAADRLRSDPAVAEFAPEGPLPPLIPTIYRAGEMRLSLFSTFMQLGGTEDITLSELRVELMFPADEASKAVLAAMG